MRHPMKHLDDPVRFRGRANWRRWLAAHCDRRAEVWLVVPKRRRGAPVYRRYYNEAVEEAICFGWIDSRIRSLDREQSAVRFTPRTSPSWSKYNIARALRMIDAGRMTAAGIKALPKGIRRLTRASSGRASSAGTGW